MLAILARFQHRQKILILNLVYYLKIQTFKANVLFLLAMTIFIDDNVNQYVNSRNIFYE